MVKKLEEKVEGTSKTSFTEALIPDQNESCDQIEAVPQSDDDEIHQNQINGFTENTNGEIPTEKVTNNKGNGPLCSGLLYPQMTTIGMCLSILDPVTDFASVGYNISYLSPERIVHGILILTPVFFAMVSNHVSRSYRDQKSLLKLTDGEKKYFDSWWLKVGIFDTFYWGYKHCRATGDKLNEPGDEEEIKSYYRTKQMLQLSTKIEAIMEASFQATLTLFRILRFYVKSHPYSVDFWLAITSLVFSCLSIGRAASSDLVKTNIKGGNIELLDDETVNENAAQVNEDELNKIKKENNLIKSFCIKPQSLVWKICRTLSLSFQTGATILAVVTFILSFFWGWTPGSSNAPINVQNFTWINFPGLNAKVPAVVNSEPVGPQVNTSHDKINLTAFLGNASTTESSEDIERVHSFTSGLIGMILVFFISTLIQIPWGMIAYKEVFIENFFPICSSTGLREKWLSWLEFVIRSPFICIFRSGSLYYYSLTAPVITSLVLQNGLFLFILIVPAIIYVNLIGWTAIMIFAICLLGYFIFTAISFHFVEPMELNSVSEKKRLVLQRIAQLP